VDGRVVDVAGLRVAGLGGSRRYRPGPNQYTERQQARRARRLVARARRKRPRGPVDLVITHAPPAGVGDDRADPVHQGFEAFRYLISALQPGLFVHGHVAPAGGSIEHRVGPTRVVNVFDHQVLDLDCPTAPTAGR
jgi:Icc-related predicted phosphoesterase